MKKTYTYKRIVNLRYTLILLVAMLITTSESFAQFNALDYRLQKRPKLDSFDNPKFKDNTFMSVGAGLKLNFLNEVGGMEIGPSASYYFGKWFTPINGARVGIDMAFLYDKNYGTSGLFGVNVDYLANITSFARGYNPDRLFEFYGIAGLTYKRSFRYGSGKSFYGGVLGFQGNFTLSPLVDLYIEPKVTMANDSYNDPGKNLARKFDLLPEVTFGVTYKMVPEERRQTTEFKEKSFNENLFFTTSFGVQRIISRMLDINGKDYVGFGGMLGFGGWFDELQGLRISALAGYSPYSRENEISGTKKLISGTLRADYLVNYSNLFGGYNENRIFKLIGTFGLEMAVTKYLSGTSKLSGGVGLGLQGAFRVSPTIDLFLEPRISFYNKSYTHGITNRFDSMGSVFMGLTYHNTNRESKREHKNIKSKSNTENIFATLSAGVGAPFSKYDEDLHGADLLTYRVNLGIGKWFNQRSGLQITGGTMLLGTRNPRVPDNAPYRVRTMTLGADYLLNITNVVLGYKENRLFELVGGAGLSAIYHHTTFYPAIQAFLRGNFNLANDWSLYIEPHGMWSPSRGLFLNTVSTRRVIIFTANVGASYALKGTESASYKEFVASNGKKLFFTLGAGVSGILDNQLFYNTKDRIGPIGRFSVGRWETPILGWRASAMAEKINQVSKKDISHAGLEADVMFNVVNAVAGYKPYRVFDMNLNAGVHLGMSIVDHSKRFIPGLRGGLQGIFNITPSVGIYVEPQMAIYLNKFDAVSKQKTTVSLLAGLTYTMDNTGRDKSAKHSDMENKNVVSAHVGFGLYGNTLMSRYKGKFADNMTYSLGVSYGRWINPVHGLRFNVDYNLIQKPYQVSAKPLGIAVTRVDYMLNMTSLIRGYDPDSRFDAVLFAGVGAAMPLHSKNHNMKTTYTAAFGLKANVRVTDRINVYAEPRGIFYGDKIDGYKSNAGFDATGMVLVGIDYKF